MNNKPNIRYVLITPARNEEDFIEKTLKSVIAQTVLPDKWIIVNDCSTDNTEEIIKNYTYEYDFIELIRNTDRKEGQFAAKVKCFNLGYKKIKMKKFEVIGNLDADISFDNEYIEFLLDKFIKDENLGVAGTPFKENGYSSIKDGFEGLNHVPGGCQLFRRQCFDEIGGYQSIRGGGIDWIAVTTARMKGWRTRAYKEKVFYHHRRLGTKNGNAIKAKFEYGIKDYYLGGSILWELFRFSYQMSKSPKVIGGIALMCGYIWCIVTRRKKVVSKELEKFHRSEQVAKIKKIIKKSLNREKIDKFNLNNNENNHSSYKL